MKKYVTYIKAACLSTALMFGATACSDYLDKSEESDISATEPYKNFTNFQGFVELLYNNIPLFDKGYWSNSFNWGDDEVVSANINYHMVYKIDQGDFWGWQSEFDGWGTGWLDRSEFDAYAKDRFKKDSGLAHGGVSVSATWVWQISISSPTPLPSRRTLLKASSSSSVDGIISCS